MPAHGVYDNREAARTSDLCLSHIQVQFDGERPILQFQSASVAGQQNIRRLVA